MIKLIKPYIYFDDVRDDFESIFDSGSFTKGKYVESLREEIRNYTGAQYAYLTTSATTALTMALKAVGIKKGDEVVVSDFSFPATANVVEDLGAIPIFTDVSLKTYNMMTSELEKKITPKTKAVIFVDALGNPDGVSEIKELCLKKNIPLIEDAACAVGSSEYGTKCGNIADISCFSFHPRKLLTTGEGGAITFNDEKYETFFDIKLNHGAIIEDGKFNFIDYGYNYRLPELQAAMGIKQFEKLDTIVSSRNEIRQQYIDKLSGTGFIAQKSSKNVVHNIQSLVFTTPDMFDRDQLIHHLKKHGIESTIGTYCLSATTFYKSKYNDLQPNAHWLEMRTITLPCYDNVDVGFVSETIKNF